MKVNEIIENDLSDLKAMQDLSISHSKIQKKKYPELDEDGESLRQHVVLDSAIKNGEIKETPYI